VIRVVQRERDADLCGCNRAQLGVRMACSLLGRARIAYQGHLFCQEKASHGAVEFLKSKIVDWVVDRPCIGEFSMRLGEQICQ
jgi:hypothetical protein